MYNNLPSPDHIIQTYKHWAFCGLKCFKLYENGGMSVEVAQKLADHNHSRMLSVHKQADVMIKGAYIQLLQPLLHFLQLQLLRMHWWHWCIPDAASFANTVRTKWENGSSRFCLIHVWHADMIKHWWFSPNSLSLLPKKEIKKSSYNLLWVLEWFNVTGDSNDQKHYRWWSKKRHKETSEE